MNNSSASLARRQANIIISEPDAVQAGKLAELFVKEGFGVYSCLDVSDIMQVEHENVKAILVDLSGKDRNDAIRMVELVKQSPVGTHIPMLVSADIPSAQQIVVALNAGADDYILKPYSQRELLSHIYSLAKDAED